MSETLFKQVNYTLGSLIEFIRLGQIGLPDIQRPFVWPNTKVREKAILDMLPQGTGLVKEFDSIEGYLSERGTV
jgi:hypothetical protein